MAFYFYFFIFLMKMYAIIIIMHISNNGWLSTLAENLL